MGVCKACTQQQVCVCMCVCVCFEDWDLTNIILEISSSPKKKLVTVIFNLVRDLS